MRLRLGRQLRLGLDSGDILQETFIAAVRAFDGFEMRDEASLLNWLARLAERQIIAAADYDHAKKRDRKRNVPLAGPPGPDTSGPVGVEFSVMETHPLDRMAAEEETEAVEKCLAELPEEYRELVILRNYVGYSWDEIAKETGRPTAAAARMMYNRAVVELGKLMRG